MRCLSLVFKTNAYKQQKYGWENTEEFRLRAENPTEQ